MILVLCQLFLGAVGLASAPRVVEFLTLVTLGPLLAVGHSLHAGIHSSEVDLLRDSTAALVVCVGQALHVLAEEADRLDANQDGILATQFQYIAGSIAEDETADRGQRAALLL